MAKRKRCKRTPSPQTMDGDLLESIKRCWGELNEKTKMTETKDNAEVEEVVELRRRLTVLQEDEKDKMTEKDFSDKLIEQRRRLTVLQEAATRTEEF